MARVISWLNETIARLAHGIKGKTRTLHFEPVMKKGQKCMVTRECPKCAYKHAPVGRDVETKMVYAIMCPRCCRVTYKVHSSTDMRAASQKGTQEAVKQLTCKGKKADGSPCRVIVKNGDYCHHHKDQGRDIASQI
jgi:hypothetical protein